MPVLEEIQSELVRVVGQAGTTVSQDGNQARIETSESVWHMSVDELLEILRSLPDQSGPLVLRQASEQRLGRLSSE